jgi:hypothetical protein
VVPVRSGHSGYQVERDETGQAIVIDDTLTCLAHANPTDRTTSNAFATDEHQDLYEAAFDTWAAAKIHIHTGWMFNADPAKLTRPIPRVMRDATDLVRTKGAFLGDRQDDMVERLEAPYAPRIQRAVRDILTEDRINDRTTVTQLLTLADQLGLSKQPAPEPLPPITCDDIHLVCWTAVTPD